MVAKLLSFFEVVELCRVLDAEHTDMFRKKRRHTKIDINENGAEFKVFHNDHGIVNGVIIHLCELDDMDEAIRALHNHLDEKLRKQRCMEDDILEMPF